VHRTRDASVCKINYSDVDILEVTGSGTRT
jgi:hypothetical protein